MGGRHIAQPCFHGQTFGNGAFSNPTIRWPQAYFTHCPFELKQLGKKMFLIYVLIRNVTLHVLLKVAEIMQVRNHGSTSLTELDKH